ncbi:hypothetical protein KGF54_004676 [Candida jiufengensis]|uniref:uncharacterized protein n=1 Tax=Candida jiufengensis TaxID=497108 RepID=UPI0022254E4B|nr:uncharacterized protein KGF54_004676 [Candida jiufengensis]KAI5951602.1 hypothetical protein KGF54_004676 [Candida jiufengensis]
MHMELLCEKVTTSVTSISCFKSKAQHWYCISTSYTPYNAQHWHRIVLHDGHPQPEPHLQIVEQQFPPFFGADEANEAPVFGAGVDLDEQHEFDD